MILATKYKNDKIERKLAYEKALLLIVADGGEAEKELYRDFVIEEANYKALERILKAHEAKISLSQSLIKNQVRNG